MFGESRKIFDQVPDNKPKARDNDEISDQGDIDHAVQKGIKKLNQEIMIRKMSKMIAER